MQKTVESVRSEVKEELSEKSVSENRYTQRFNVDNILDKHTGNPELWSLRYLSIYSQIFDAVNLAFETPLPNKDSESDDVYDSISSGINEIVDTISGVSNIDTISVLNIRDRFEEFMQNENDEITLNVTLHGQKSKIQLIEEYYRKGGIVTVNLNGEITNEEEVALREYNESLIKKFCARTPYQNRPNNRFKRVLSISMKKTDDEEIITVHCDTHRMKYTLLEKICVNLGFNPQRQEPIKQLDNHI